MCSRFCKFSSGSLGLPKNGRFRNGLVRTKFISCGVAASCDEHAGNLDQGSLMFWPFSGPSSESRSPARAMNDPLIVQCQQQMFGQIKRGRGFRQFLLRGLAKVNREWRLICAGHNLLKRFRFGAGMSVNAKGQGATGGQGVPAHCRHHDCREAIACLHQLPAAIVVVSFQFPLPPNQLNNPRARCYQTQLSREDLVLSVHSQASQ